MCLFLSLADTCVKARVGRKADEKLNVSHKEIFIISLARGGHAQSQKSFWQLGELISKQEKQHLNANTTLF